MARVHKRKARANIYAQGIKVPNENTKKGYRRDKSKPADENDRLLVEKGQHYYTWTLHGCQPSISLTPPKRQQLTQSDFLCQLYDLEDELSEIREAVSCPDELQATRDDLAERIRTLGEEQQEKLDNMPESLQQGPTGQLLEERVNAMEEWASELESVDLEWPYDEEWDETDEDMQLQFLEEKCEELSNCCHSL